MNATETAEHTPGPWKVISRANQTGYKSAIVVSPPAGNARITSFDFNGDGTEVEANARLIAAAPELLEALEAVLGYLRELWPDEPLFSNNEFEQADAICQAEMAIKKARGE